MAFISSVIRSKVLNQDMNLDLFLPNDYLDKVNLTKPQAIMYFLHGFGRSGKYAKEHTAISRYARDNNMAVVYIDAPQSWYSDGVRSGNYFTYITEELPALLKNIFGLEYPREKTFLAGLSMGGYGTWKVGLSRPDLFGAIAPLSAPSDFQSVVDAMKKVEDGSNILGFKTFFNTFGDDLELGEMDDPFRRLKKVSELPAEQQPRIRVMCGKQDKVLDIYQQNVKLDRYAKTLPLADYKFWQWDGEHEEVFWDRAVLHAIAFFLENDYDEQEIRKWRCERE
ncbi:MAG: hypothetical protein IKU54_01245 [Oscillospiraceae bacterium]|nr:hypothetical protein [Oscillospiraceae bacterium]